MEPRKKHFLEKTIHPSKKLSCKVHFFIKAMKKKEASQVFLEDFSSS
jgi:hypothetical protein